MPWLGAGGVAELGRRLGTRRRRHRILVAFPGVCAFRLTVRFGANVSYSLAAIPLFAGRVVAGPPLRAPCGPDLLTRLADQWPGMGAMQGERPRKAASRSLGPAVAATVTGAANSGCRPARGTSTGTIASRPVARGRGIGWRCPHARDMSHPWTVTSRAAAAAMTLAASGQPAMS